MKPSPARAAAPEPAAWLSIADLGEVLDLEVQFWADEFQPVHRSDPHSGVVLVPPAALPDATPAPAPAPAPARTRVLTPPQAPARPTLAQAVVLTATVAAVAVGALLASGTKQHQVTMELDGRSATRATDAGTVGDLLREQHVAVGPLDRVVPGLQAHLDDGVVVRVDRDALAARTGEGAPALPSALDAAQPAVVPVSASPAPTAPPSVPAAATPPSSAAVAVSAASPATAARQSTPSSKPVTSRPVPVAVRPVNGSAAGGASWYASPFGSDSCASRTLKFGTVVTITNVQTGATATCRVADRGPVARSRVLDLDNDVFRRLSPLGIGVIPVQITW